jgi:hypothetical protein
MYSGVLATATSYRPADLSNHCTAPPLAHWENLFVRGQHLLWGTLINTMVRFFLVIFSPHTDCDYCMYSDQLAQKHESAVPWFAGALRSKDGARRSYTGPRLYSSPQLIQTY